MKIGKIEIKEGDKIRFMIGIRIFIGTVKEITAYNDIIVEDLLGNVIAFKPRNAKFIQLLTTEEWNRILERYNQNKK